MEGLDAGSVGVGVRTECASKAKRHFARDIPRGCAELTPKIE